MALKTYLMIVFGISIALYLVGYTSPFVKMMGEVGIENVTFNSVINGIWAIFSNPVFLASLGIAAIGSLLLIGGSGQSTLFIVPIIILMAFANYFILPTGEILASNLPTIIKFITNTFLNLFLMSTIIEFVAGRG